MDPSMYAPCCHNRPKALPLVESGYTYHSPSPTKSAAVIGACSRRQDGDGSLLPGIWCVAALCLGVKPTCRAGVRRHSSHSASHFADASGAQRVLLVDGDTHSVDEVRAAIRILELQGQPLQTVIFTAPGLEKNKRWQQLSQRPDISFESVERPTSLRGEATDGAIEARVRQLSRPHTATYIALMVSDHGYAKVMHEARCLGKSVVAVCPEKKYYVIENFENLDIPVVKVPPARDSSPRVRALLQDDGEGCVYLAEPRQAYDGRQQSVIVRDFLMQHGYVADEGQPLGRYLLHAIAKFWFTNKLGPLTVFPQQCATEALHEIIQNCTRPRIGNSWKRLRAGMAFFLPKTGGGARTKKQLRTFGSSLAYQVFNGGGPFLLEDSADLVKKAMQRLGYLDSDLNNELSEAMLVFINNTKNKHHLRKMDALPSPQDGASAVQDKLRQAFQSDQGSGQWHVGPKQIALRYQLVQAGYLENTEASQNAVLEAARLFARAHQLPEMKTLNGSAFRIMRMLNMNPTRLPDTIEFRT